MKKAILAVLAGLAVFMAGAVVASAGSGNTSGPEPGSKVVVSGCVIRFPPEITGQPQIHANNSHRCAGVDRVGIASNGRLRVVQHTSDWQRHPIISAVAQADETLVARGILVGGPSGGNAASEYQFYDTTLGRELDLKNRSDRLRIAGSSSNLWLTWIHADTSK